MKSSIVFAIFALLVAGSVPAFADMYILNIDGCTGGCGTGPFGEVAVNAAGTDKVQVDVTLYDGIKFVKTGAGSRSSFAFDLDGFASVAIGPITSSVPMSLVNKYSDNLHMSTFGYFDYGITCGDCKMGGDGAFVGPISFTLTAAGLTPASFSPSTDGSPSVKFVADIINTNVVGATKPTGLVGATAVPNSVPEPAGVFLVGTALIGLGWKFRNRVS